MRVQLCAPPTLLREITLISTSMYTRKKNPLNLTKAGGESKRKCSKQAIHFLLTNLHPPPRPPQSSVFKEGKIKVFPHFSEAKFLYAI